MKKRNPEATCETCPYFNVSDHYSHHDGDCRKNSTGEYGWNCVQKNDWCGEHPDFFVEDET